jgi:hypothetical protein
LYGVTGIPNLPIYPARKLNTEDGTPRYKKSGRIEIFWFADKVEFPNLNWACPFNPNGI